MNVNPIVDGSPTQKSTGVVRCPNCTSTVNGDQNYCPFCNTSLKIKVCSGCQASIPAAEDPCHLCGTLGFGEVMVINTGYGEIIRKCPKCQALVHTDDNTCPQCSQVLKSERCPNCEAYIPASEDPCHFCGDLEYGQVLGTITELGERVSKCPKCQATVHPEDNDCPFCNQVLRVKLCSSCKAYLPASEDPCHLCGAINPISTSQPLPIQVEGKKFGIRAGAYVIDSIVIFILGTAVSSIVGLLIGVILLIAVAMTGKEFTFDDQANQWLNIIVSIVLFTIYFTTFEWLYGATPGKLILRMRVVKEDGAPCDLKAAFVRALLRYIDGLLFGIPAYMSMDKPLYQRIGDKSAKTIVAGSRDAIIQKPRAWWWFLIAAGIYLALDVIWNVFLIVGMIR
jgi:uncharacterized RDD family membrane protein YckC/RNA polymerase subunit RPABC4/transcription elongation factor Spt4